MFILFYSAALAAGLVLTAPWWGVRLVRTGRYREGLRERLGLVPPALRSFVAGRRVVWVHAVSVGEVLAASRLVAELGEALGPDTAIVISTTTPTGQQLARERFNSDRVFYMPLDLTFSVRRFLRALRPSLLVLMESELWPRLIHECAQRGVPVAVANARVSDRSYVRSMKLRALWRRAFGQVDLWLAQSDEDADRLRALGAKNVQDAGNLKYDVRAPRQSRIAEMIRTAAAGRPIVVAGSTVDAGEELEEESVVIHAWEGAPRRDCGAVLVLAPRHPERFPLVTSLAAEFVFARASDWARLAPNALPRAAQSSAHNEIATRRGELSIVLLDTIGDLAAVYGIADAAFVGGSLARRGGHNPLEPAQFGVPVIMGPSYENFRGIVNDMRAQDAILIADDKDDIEWALTELLHNRTAARALGARGRAVFEARQGATQRTVVALAGLLGAGPA